MKWILEINNPTKLHCRYMGKYIFCNMWVRIYYS